MNPTTDLPPDKALLSFSLGPVQTFIAAARTVRDLWTGSYLLSWLTVAAMDPLRDVSGVEFITPALDGNPLPAAFRRSSEEAQRLPIKDRRRTTTPCLPNRFLALVPADKGLDLARACEGACRDAWERISRQVHRDLSKLLQRPLYDDDELWRQQINSFFEVRTVVLPPLADAHATLKELGISAVGWPEFDLLGGLADAARSVRHVPAYRPPADDEGRFPVKCSLLGSFEQIGPAHLGKAKEFWERIAESKGWKGTRVGRAERLSALSLVKRFAWPAFLADKLGLKPKELRFSDTATVAASLWLRDNDPTRKPNPDPDEVRQRTDDWNGQWLHWAVPKQDPDEPECPPEVFDLIQMKKGREKPPTYYAVLMTDGDHMGRMLRGKSGPNEWGQGAERSREISRRLAHFALNKVEKIVEEDHAGEVIYAGGDDLMALLATRVALDCAQALYEDYRRPDLMTAAATLSGGLAVVHVKEDLRSALRIAHEAEKVAKNAGRDALAVTVCRRSGEHTTAVLGWGQIASLQKLVAAFVGKDTPPVSDRWAYKLRAELPSLLGRQLPEADRLPWRAIESEVRRLLDRIEFGEGAQKKAFTEEVLKLLSDYRAELKEEKRQRKDKPLSEADIDANALEGFVTLCQSASFLARGRDE